LRPLAPLRTSFSSAGQSATCMKSFFMWATLVYFCLLDVKKKDIETLPDSDMVTAFQEKNGNSINIEKK
jgi:hypothetical protein